MSINSPFQLLSHRNAQICQFMVKSFHFSLSNRFMWGMYINLDVYWTGQPYQLFNPLPPQIYQSYSTPNISTLDSQIPSSIYQRQRTAFNILNSKQFLYNYTMRKIKNAEPISIASQNSLGRKRSIQGKKHYSSHKNLKERLLDYEKTAKKSKQQSREVEPRRRLLPDSNRYAPLLDENPKASSPRSKPAQLPRAGEYYTTIPNPEHRYAPKDNLKQEYNLSPKDSRIRSQQREQTNERERLSADAKVSSARKKRAINNQEYRKLHQKLDLIEHRISDMKKHLEKKKEEKFRVVETGIQQCRTPDDEGRDRKLKLNVLVTKMPELQDMRTFETNPYSPRNSIYYVSELVKAYKDELSMAREHLLASLHILKLLKRSKPMTEEEMSRIKVNLPRRKGYENKKTIVFDLDETLIHCKDSTTLPYDVKLPITFPTGEKIEAAINIRPYAREILRNLSQHFELIIFTASHSCYANEVIDYMDPNKEWVHHRLFREHCCLSPEGFYVKDLRILGRNLNEVVLVDNAAYSYAFQLENGIPIYPYYQGRSDFQLRVLEDYLMKLLTRDMRATNDSTFKLTQYRHYYSKPNKLVEDLYINK